MQGVTTALVAFIFFCVIFPERVRNRPQFYSGLALICLIIILDALSYMLGSSGFRVFTYFATAVLQVGAILVMFMAAGGLSWRDLKSEMGNAYEVIRRGGEEKEIIIPLSGQKPKRPADDEDSPPPPIKLDMPPAPGSPAAPKPEAPDKGIPLE
jgi:hypothetical protein